MEVAESSQVYLSRSGPLFGGPKIAPYPADLGKNGGKGDLAEKLKNAVEMELLPVSEFLRAGSVFSGAGRAVPLDGVI